MNILGYDKNKYNFTDIVKKYLNVNELSKIHEKSDFIYHTKFKRENDQSTHYHKLFYDLARSEEFLNLYTTFIKDVIKKHFDCNIVYQKIPTFRMQFPNNIAVGEYHRDRDYRDTEWASTVKELNFYLPITKAINTNTIWVESEEGKMDFKPINALPGEVVVWDGLNLLHGNKENKEELTRVSIDFRVMKLQNYIPLNRGSINTNVKFEIGGYYEQI
jgi:ectoine hydroxylase-related dioxygenase (phytanoyl-CoA dioxygenase family)